MVVAVTAARCFCPGDCPGWNIGGVGGAIVGIVGGAGGGLAACTCAACNCCCAASCPPVPGGVKARSIALPTFMLLLHRCSWFRRDYTPTAPMAGSVGRLVPHPCAIQRSLQT